MSKMDDKFIDLAITSPPYNMRLRIRNGKYTSRQQAQHFSKKYSHFNDNLPIEHFYTFHKQVIEQLLRVSKIVCYNFQIVTGSKQAFFRIISDFRTQIKDIIVWDKGHGQPAINKNVLNSCYQLILIMQNNGIIGRTIQNAKFDRGTMENIIRVRNKRSKKNTHKAVFPEQLINRLLIAFSNQNDIVYDPFMGTGTVAKCCKDLNRFYIGSEIIQEYCQISNQRLLDGGTNGNFTISQI